MSFYNQEQTKSLNDRVKELEDKVSYLEDLIQDFRVAVKDSQMSRFVSNKWKRNPAYKKKVKLPPPMWGERKRGFYK